MHLLCAQCYLHVRVYVYVFMLRYMCAYVLCMHVYVCVCMYTYVFVCMYVYSSKCIKINSFNIVIQQNNYRSTTWTVQLITIILYVILV